MSLLQEAGSSGEQMTVSSSEASLKRSQAQAEGLDLILGHWTAMAEFRAGEGHSQIYTLERPLWLL